LPTPDDSEKRVGSSDSVLLVRQNLCRRESHHREELGEKLRAKMPPGVPEEILWGGRETTDRRSFQIRVEHISDDERSGHLSTLLNNPERIAAV
jgi:hypothetical protein